MRTDILVSEQGSLSFLGSLGAHAQMGLIGFVCYILVAVLAFHLDNLSFNNYY
jgi:hypothetical protein